MSENEDKLQAAHSLGMAAAAELEVLTKAFAAVKAQYTEGWLLSDPRDGSGREKLWVATTILTRVERQLRQYVSDGKVAERNIEELRKAGEPKKRLALFS